MIVVKIQKKMCLILIEQLKLVSKSVHWFRRCGTYYYVDIAL